jgi:tetratricopeptide (TPR) repeat protein
MAEHHHLRAEHYATAVARPEGASVLARRVHDHRIALCADCRSAWERLAGLQTTYLSRLDRLISPPPPLSRQNLDDLSTEPAKLGADVEEVAELRRLRRRAKEELWELLRLPPVGRRRRIKGARRRFRSRLLAEMLIAECRARARREPEDSGQLAELVPLILAWTHGPGGPRWAPPLLARTAALRAHALYLSGDQAAAEAAFVRLRRGLAGQPVGDPGALGEVAWLEASLYLAQRRLPEALEFLERADVCYRYAADHGALARTRTRMGALLRVLGRPADALRLLSAAARAVSEVEDGDRLALLTARIEVLCDLARFDEAQRALDRSLDAFEASDEPRAGFTVRHLQGRIDLGLGRWQAAAGSFAAAARGMLALDEVTGAVAATLREAEAYLRAGRRASLRRLAESVPGLARREGVSDEAREALRLMVRAIATDRLTVEMLARLREPMADRAMELEWTTFP